MTVTTLPLGSKETWAHPDTRSPDSRRVEPAIGSSSPSADTVKPVISGRLPVVQLSITLPSASKRSSLVSPLLRT